jgi:hypothetical protein
MLNCDMRMFSGSANRRRQPPVATGVDARAYVGSGSMTPTRATPARLRKYAAAQPMTPPPMMATS